MTAAAPTASAAPAAVPWRRLALVTWRQRRTALTWALIVLALTAAVLALIGVTLHDVATEHHGSYKLAVQPWARYAQLGMALSLVMPVLAGVFLGAPLVAREAENGTTMLAWTHDASRTRWLLAQAVPVVALLSVAAAAIQLEFGRLPGFRASLGQIRANLCSQFDWSAEAFTVHPLPLAGWTALTFSLGVLLGAVIRRTVPAIAATLAGAAALYAAAVLWRPFYLPPLHRAIPTQWSGPHYFFGSMHLFRSRGAEPDLISTALGLRDGRLLSYAQATHHTTQWLRMHHLSLWITYQPGSRYGTFQLIEFGWLTVLSMILVAATVTVIRRRAA
jgi:hypothetical protein